MDEDRAKVEINLQVDEDISPQDMDELTAALRRELLNLDVESVDRVSGGSGAGGLEGRRAGADRGVARQPRRGGAGPRPGRQGDPGVGIAGSEPDREAHDRW